MTSLLDFYISHTIVSRQNHIPGGKIIWDITLWPPDVSDKSEGEREILLVQGIQSKLGEIQEKVLMRPMRAYGGPFITEEIKKNNDGSVTVRCWCWESCR